MCGGGCGYDTWVTVEDQLHSYLLAISTTLLAWSRNLFRRKISLNPCHSCKQNRTNYDRQTVYHII